MKKLISAAIAVTMSATMSISAFAATAIDEDNATSAANKAEGEYTIGVNGNVSTGTSAQDIISADIMWDAMDFTYTEGTKGTWQPGSHSYSNGTTGGWSTDKSGITVKNHSNVGIDANFTFTAETGITTTGTFYTKGEDDTYTAIASVDAQMISLATAVGTEVANAPKGTIYFGVSGDAISGNKKLGTITVKIENQRRNGE